MIYEPFKRALLRLLKAPSEPPEPPAGSHGSVHVFRASPRFLRYRLLGVAILGAVLFVAALAALVAILVGGEPLALLGWLPIGAVLALVVVLRYVGVRIDYDMRHYIVTDRSIRIREGAFVIHEKTLTHANVQNMTVVQGPLMRLFGIKSLAVETAGGGAQAAQGNAPNQHRFEIAGVENAAEVRDLVLSYLRARGRDGGLGDPDDVGDVADFGEQASGEPTRRPARGAVSAVAVAELRAIRSEAERLRIAAETAR